MNIHEATAACEAHLPNVTIIATEKLQAHRHGDGTVSRISAFCISAMHPNACHQYYSSVSFGDCACQFINHEHP
jgi:hypothetical protein